MDKKYSEYRELKERLEIDAENKVQSLLELQHMKEATARQKRIVLAQARENLAVAESEADLAKISTQEGILSIQKDLHAKLRSLRNEYSHILADLPVGSIETIDTIMDHIYTLEVSQAKTLDNQKAISKIVLDVQADVNNHENEIGRLREYSVDHSRKIRKHNNELQDVRHKVSKLATLLMWIRERVNALLSRVFPGIDWPSCPSLEDDEN